MDQIRDDRAYPPSTRKELRAGDILKIEASPDEIDKFVSKLELEIGAEASGVGPRKMSDDATLMEVVVHYDSVTNPTTQLAMCRYHGFSYGRRCGQSSKCVDTRRRGHRRRPWSARGRRRCELSLRAFRR